jgi:WD40 repeat protein
VAEELPAASGDVEQTTSAVPRQTPACRSWCKRALGEAVAIIRATAGLVIRLLIYVGGLWRRRRLQHKSSLATLSLGQQALAAAVGDVSICQELGASGAATNSGKPTWQQEQLLQKLGETLVVQPAAPPSVASAWHAARSIRGQSEEQERRINALGQVLWPASAGDWLRVGVGVGSVLVASTLFLALGFLALALFRAPRSEPIAQKPAAVSDVVDLRAVGDTLTVKEKPFLMLDTNGHSSAIRSLVFTPDGRYVLTSSADKTIRVWDLASGESIRTLRLAIGHGVDGVINALNITPDGQRIAFGIVDVVQRTTADHPAPVYLVNLSDGRVERTFDKLTNLISALVISADGKRLAAGSANGEVAIWDVASGKLEHYTHSHAAGIRHLALSPDGSRMLTLAENQTSGIWSVDSTKASFILSNGKNLEVRSIAWSHNGQRLAAGLRDGTVVLLTAEGKLIKPMAAAKSDINILAFSPDDRELLLMGVPMENDRACRILNLETGKVRLEVPFHNNTVLAGSYSPDGQLAATSGGNHHETFLWRTTDGTLLRILSGKGKSVFAVGWAPDGQTIAWGHRNSQEVLAGMGFLQHTFNIGEARFAPAQRSPFRRAVHTWGRNSLALTPQKELVMLQDGRPLGTYKPPNPTDHVICYTLLPDGRVVVGSHFYMALWDPRSNKVVHEFVGHSGAVMAIALSPDSKLVLTGSADQTIRIWDPDKPRPLLSLFLADPEWVAWTEEGIYAASASGERLMGWHINNGAKEPASYYPAAQFRRSLYHPDVIRQLLRARDLPAAFALAGKPYSAGLNVSAILPPRVAITSPSGVGNIRVDQQRFEVMAKARSVGEHPVTVLRLLVDGRPYSGPAGLQRIAKPRVGEVQTSWKVELPPGVHYLSVLAESAVSRSLSPAVEVQVASGSGAQPALYVLAVGINDYPGDMRLRFAANDAEAIARTFQEKAAKLFGKVEVKLLKDRQATRREIEQGLAWLEARMTHQDVAVVFFAGHGDKDERNNFYLIPVDVNLRDLAGSCLSGDRLKERLGSMPGRVVAMLDACHSGAASERQRPPGVTDDLVRELISEDYGVIVMSSSLGSEFSLESEAVQHGFFTLSLTEGLGGKADSNRDGLVHLTEASQYAVTRVRELSRNEQTPVLAKPPIIRSFPLTQP